MKHTFFRIQNYKGIESAEIDMTSQPKGRTHTLVGLNESGKTTILEALYYPPIARDRQSQNVLDFPGHTSTADPRDLIPMSKRSNFNGIISVKVGFALDEGDHKLIAGFLKQELDYELIE